MGRGKNQNSQLLCSTDGCKHPMRYAFRINTKKRKKLVTTKEGNELKGILKYCNVCQKHTVHTTKKITSLGSTKAK